MSSEATIKNSIGLLLKQIMKQQSMSMRELGILTGIDKSTISRIINGKRKANPEHLQKLCAAKILVPLSPGGTLVDK